MCNLYRMTKGTAEVANLFNVEPDLAANYGTEVYPGYPGLVLAEGRARAMTWGFPLVLKGKQGQPLKPKPVTNAREDKLDTPFWRDSFMRRRCLIPVSQWPNRAGLRAAWSAHGTGCRAKTYSQSQGYGGRARNGARSTPW